MRPEYHTPRLHLRAWTAADAPAFKAAVDESLAHLRPWLPWAAHEPSPVEAVAERLAGFERDFAEDRWWGYGVFARGAAGPGALLGSASAHRPRRPGQRPSVREISYWLRAGATGRGYVTEAAGALVDAALAEPGVLAVEIRVDPENRASARVPERLGFTLCEHRVGDRAGPDGRALDTLVWEREAHPGRLRPAVAADVPRLAAIRAAARASEPARPARAPRVDDHALVAAGACWVWEDERGVRGFAGGAPGGDGATWGDGASWGLWVEPAAEGSPAGGALLACVTDALWALGHRRLELSAVGGSRAEAVYRAAGWAEVAHTAPGAVRWRRDLYAP